MRSPRIRWRVGDRWLLACSAVCTFALAAELLWPHDIAVTVDPLDHTARADRAQLSVHKLATIAAYGTVAERPLFSADRRPYHPAEPEPSPAPQPVAPRVTFQLSAIVTSSSAKLALLKSSTSLKVSRVGLNEVVDGWALVDIRADEVVLRKGSDAQTVTLQKPQEGKRRGATIGSVARGP